MELEGGHEYREGTEDKVTRHVFEEGVGDVEVD